MRLAELLERVFNSAADDWHKLDVHAHYGWIVGNGTIEPKEHYHTAVFNEDVNVTLAYGATVHNEFSEDWTERFPDKSAHSVAVHIRYAGVTVFEQVFVTVDGMRYLLPMPARGEKGAFIVPGGQLPFARLMFSLWGPGGVHNNLEDTLRRAGVTY